MFNFGIVTEEDIDDFASRAGVFRLDLIAQSEHLHGDSLRAVNKVIAELDQLEDDLYTMITVFHKEETRKNERQN